MAIGDIVKVVLVRLKTDGAATAKEQMAAIAEQARAIGRMDPTINVKVDKDALDRLRAMRLQLDALKLAGDKEGLRNLASEFRALGTGTDDARLRLRALRMEMEAARLSADGNTGNGGLLGSLKRLVGAGGTGGFSIGSFLGSPAGIGAIVAALASGIAGIIPALVAAGAGVVAFGALAYPTFTRLTGAISTVIHAVNNYQSASQNLDDAIRKSPADWAAYQKAIIGIEPDLRAAASLLTNQNVTWQSLSPSMQKSVTALADNKKALANLLPDQRAALTALLQQRDAWNNLTPAQQQAAASSLSISSALMSMEQAVAPLVTQIINDLLRIAQELLPAILPLATAAGTALVGLFGHLADSLKLATTQTTYFRDRFGRIHDVVTSTVTPFGQFVKQMTALSGPAITTLGEGLGRLVVALGKLMIALANPETLRTAKYVFIGIADLITFTAWTIRVFTAQVTRLFHEVAVVWDSTRYWAGVLARGVGHDFFVLAALIGGALVMAVRWVIHFEESVFRVTTNAVRWFGELPGRIVRAVGSLGSILYNAGRAVIDGFWNGLKAAWGAVSGWLSSIGGWISNLKGPLDKDLTLLRPHGRAIMTGLAMGMNDGLPGVRAQIARTTGAITGGGYGGGYGGGVIRLEVVGHGGGMLDQLFISWLRNYVRVAGGGGPQSVQRALGQVWR